MAAGKSPADVAFDEIVKRAVTSVLKPLGFRKSAMNYHRRHEKVIQVVNLQISQCSSHDEKTFYVNVGVAFDEICQLANLEIIERPKECECDSRGTRDRLERLIDKLPEQWSVGVDYNAELVERQLKSAMEQLAGQLETIDGVAAYRTHRWFDRFRPKQENAQVLYILGDMDGALSEVNHLCELFADRKAINQPKWWIDQLGLSKLSTILGTLSP